MPYVCATRSKRAKISGWLLFLLFVICIVAFMTLGYRKQVNNPLGSDLDVYLHAARSMLEDGEMYLTQNRGGKYYRYPPLLAVMISPLARAPYEYAVLTWAAINAVLLSMTCLTWYYATSGSRFWRAPLKTQWVVGGLTLLVALRYVLSHFYYGQSNLLILACIVVGCVLIFGGRSVSGGALIGLSLVIKPFAVPFMVWFTVSGRWRVVLAAAGGAVIGLHLPALQVGFGRNYEYLTQWTGHMVESASPTNVWMESNNVSLYASIHRLFTDMEVAHLDGTVSNISVLALPDYIVHATAWLAFIAILGWVIWVTRRYGAATNKRIQTAVASFIFALVPVLTTTAQKHYFVMLIPAIIYVLYAWLVIQYRDAVFRVLVVISFTLLTATGPALWPREWAQAFQSAGLISVAAILLAAAIFRTCDVPNQHSPQSIPEPV